MPQGCGFAPHDPGKCCLQTDGPPESIAGKSGNAAWRGVTNAHLPSLRHSRLFVCIPKCILLVEVGKPATPLNMEGSR